MTRDQVVRLFRDVQIDPALKEQLNASATVEDFVAMAKDFGYQFTVEEWRESIRFSVEEPECKMSEIPGI